MLTIGYGPGSPWKQPCIEESRDRGADVGCGRLLLWVDDPAWKLTCYRMTRRRTTTVYVVAGSVQVTSGQVVMLDTFASSRIIDRWSEEQQPNWILLTAVHVDT